MIPVGGLARHCMICRVAVPVSVTAGRARAGAAYWLAGSAGRLAGAELDLRRLDSAAAVDATPLVRYTNRFLDIKGGNVYKWIPVSNHRKTLPGNEAD